MPELFYAEISCGVRQLSGLCRDTAHYSASDQIPPAEVLIEAFKNSDDNDWGYHLPKAVSDIKFGMVIFSDSTRRGNGKKLAAFIEKKGLGKIIPSDTLVNPNTKRSIQMWIWQLNRTALIKWFKENAAEDYEQQEQWALDYPVRYIR